MTLPIPAGSDEPGLALTVLSVPGSRPGPRVVVLGGVHGDEYEGMAAAAAISSDVDQQALRGSLTIVPVCNPPAFRAARRTAPADDRDLARVFPGDAAGSVTERIAHALTAHVIRGCDLLIDLHSAGQHYAIPLLVGSYAGDGDLARRCQAAALAFGAPINWAHQEIAPGRSLSAALAADIPCIYAECGGGGTIRQTDLRAYRHGVRRVLAHLGMLPAMDAAPPPGLRLLSSGDLDRSIRVTSAGLFLARVRLLDRVAKGQPLADVLDLYGGVVETVCAPAAGIVIMLRRTARVAAGDRVVALAQEAPDAAIQP